MAWAIVAVVGLAVIGILIFVLSRPMRIPREPEREGQQKGEAVTAYANMGGWFMFRLERHLVMRALANQKPGTWLDIGCGPGYLDKAIHKRYPTVRIIGLDNNPEMLSLAKLQVGVEFVLGDAQNLPLEANSIDFLVTSLSLHHWPQAGPVFREMCRVLKPNAQFLVFDLRRDAARLFYWTIILGQIISPPAIRRTNGGVGSFWSSYTPAELEQILTASQIDDIRIDSRIGWMLARGAKKGD